MSAAVDPAGTRPWDLVTLGDLVADLIVPIASLPVEAGRHQLADWMKVEAGGAANTLIMAQRLGLRTVTIGVLGQDSMGQQVKAILQREKVDPAGMILSPQVPSSLSIVLVDEAGDHVFIGGGQKASTRVPFAPGWETIVRTTRSLFTSGYAMNPRSRFGPGYTMRCLQAARDAGCRIHFDLGPPEFLFDRRQVREGLVLSDVLLATADEIRHWTGLASPRAAAHQVLDDGPTCVVVKEGEAGCQVFTRERAIACPGFAVEMIDSTGAGDAFAAGFIMARLAGSSLREAGIVANAVGAAAVTVVGTGSLLPPRARVVELLNTVGVTLPHPMRGGSPS